MTTAIYIIWALIPAFFFLMALWSFLEKTSGKKKHERPGDLFNQGMFVTICVAICVALNIYALPLLVSYTVGDAVPYLVFQVVLLPFILFLAAKIIGPSKAIQIEKISEVSKAKSKR